jgi:hypothetical protein
MLNQLYSSIRFNASLFTPHLLFMFTTMTFFQACACPRRAERLPSCSLTLSGECASYSPAVCGY